jgi:hypothetical protein
MSTASFLPPEAIRSALDTLELLQAMYPLPDELSLLQPPSASQLALLRAIVESTPPGPLPTTLPPYIRMIIRIGIDSDAGGGDEGEGRYSMELEVGIPLMKGIETSLYLRQPSWMSKGRYGELVESLPEKTNHGEGEDNTVEDVLLRVEKVKEEGARYLPEKTPEPVLGGGYEVEPDENGMDRVWFWLSVAFPDLIIWLEDVFLADVALLDLADRYRRTQTISVDEREAKRYHFGCTQLEIDWLRPCRSVDADLFATRGQLH